MAYSSPPPSGTIDFTYDFFESHRRFGGGSPIVESDFSSSFSGITFFVSGGFTAGSQVFRRKIAIIADTL
jgi:hypothetical protein